MRFGCHVSIAGKIYLAVDRAEARGCETMQIFSGNPRGWQDTQLLSRNIQEFNRRLKEAKIYPLVIHLPYLVNLGATEKNIRSKSAKAMFNAIERAKKLKASYLVFHPGSHKGKGKEEGLIRVVSSLIHLLPLVGEEIKVLLENTSGAGFNLGANLAEFKFVFEELGWDSRLGICFDTAHALAAGYDLSTKTGLDKTLKELDDVLGIERLYLIHANDSRTPCGSHLDRHEDIGKGYIGLKGFKRIVNHPLLRNLPCILETPHMSLEDDVRNLNAIKALYKEL
ncbi:MAG: deoxyribonuclease IV [Candidatus Subteraquimicrobiales bacterium]|nr:deoxyribonuclease IV [Candidatus Subteraquimicrobiales bacterium]